MSSFDRVIRARNTKISWLAALVFSWPAFSPAQQVAIIEHRLATQAGAIGITAGPDGALWFTEYYDGEIGRITTAGAITEYSALGNPWGIAAGPDGALWFTDQILNGDKIGRITTAGEITEYPVPTPHSEPYGITTGPDGALWFTEGSGNKIGRITTAGAITEYPIPTTDSAPYGITAGSDGALWFTEFIGNKIGRITTGGAITEYPVPTGDSAPYGITAGSDGALWFTEVIGNKIGRITTSGAITEYPLPATGSYPYGITAGPDGALWFTENCCNKIGRITTAGAITEYPIPNPGSYPYGITAGPDGALWFTESYINTNDRIGQIVFPTAVLTANPETGPPGTTVTRTGSGFGPGESVNLYANSTGSNLVFTANADSAGSFSVINRAHEVPYGSYSVVAVGQTSGKLGVAPFFFTPRLIIQPGTGAPGSTMTVQGFGFGAGEDVDLYWSQPRTPLGFTYTNGLGTFSGATALTFTVPPGAQPGVNGVFGKGGETGAIGIGYVNVE